MQNDEGMTNANARMTMGRFVIRHSGIVMLSSFVIVH
jgi:hypothetical protein